MNYRFLVVTLISLGMTAGAFGMGEFFERKKNIVFNNIETFMDSILTSKKKMHRLITKPVCIVLHTTPADILNKVNHGTIGNLPVISSFFQDGKQLDYSKKIRDGYDWVHPVISEGLFYTPYNHALVTLFGAYALYKNKWGVRTKLVNAYKSAKNTICSVAK